MTAPRAPVTIKSLAEELGVSHATVSRALNDSPLVGADTRQRIRGAARARGYVAHAAARMMRGETSGLIGLVLPDVRTALFSELTTVLAELCAGEGLQLFLSVSQHDPRLEEAQILALREARVSGVLIYPTAGLTDESRAMLADVPTVQVARRHPRLEAAFVGSDDAASMAELVRHLLALGHRRIGFIGSDPSMSPGLDRQAAFAATLAECAVRQDERWTQMGSATATVGRHAAERLLDPSMGLTALLVASAPMADGALDVITERGLRLPANLSLIGFGDPPWYRGWGPGITSVAIPVAAIAGEALATLRAAERSGGRTDPAATLRIASQVLLRGTTGPPTGSRAK